MNGMSVAMQKLEQLYLSCNAEDRVALRRPMEYVLGKYAAFRLQMMDSAETATARDLEEMQSVLNYIDEAKGRSMLLMAIERTVRHISSW